MDSLHGIANSHQQPIEMHAGLPVLRGFICRVLDWYDGNDGFEYRAAMIEIRCPACEAWHVHSWCLGDGLDVFSHRIAHCRRDDSPFKHGGYYLALLPLDAAHVVDPTVAIRRPVTSRTKGRRS